MGQGTSGMANADSANRRAAPPASCSSLVRSLPAAHVLNPATRFRSGRCLKHAPPAVTWRPAADRPLGNGRWRHPPRHRMWGPSPVPAAVPGPRGSPMPVEEASQPSGAGNFPTCRPAADRPPGNERSRHAPPRRMRRSRALPTARSGLRGASLPVREANLPSRQGNFPLREAFAPQFGA